MSNKILILSILFLALTNLTLGEMAFTERPASYEDVRDINLSHYNDGEKFSTSNLNDERDLGYIIEIKGNKSSIRNKIQSIGGDIGHSYDSLIDGFSIKNIGREDIETLKKLNETIYIQKEQFYDSQLDDIKQEINLDNVPDYSTDLNGNGVNISIIDSGVDYTHPALGDCTEFEFEQNSCGKVTEGYDFVDEDENPIDESGHGTHVAGIAAANGEKKGIAPKANIHAYRVLDESGGTSSDLLAAIERSIENEADIIVMSLGSGSGSPGDILSEAVRNASDDSLIVIAAGNKQKDGGLNTITSPGDTFNALTVGASNGSKPAYFSSRGPVIWYDDNGIQRAIQKPDILAPSIEVNSTVPGGNYDTKTGTSMATPVVAGAAALLKQEKSNINPDEMKSEIKSSTNHISGYPWEIGSGKLNAEKLFGRPSPQISEINLNNTNDSINSTEIRIENPSNSENLNLSLGFSTTYNISSSDKGDINNIADQIFTINQSDLDLKPGESTNVSISVDTSREGVYSSTFWLNDTIEEYYYSRPVTTSVGTLLENGSEIEVALEEKPDEFIRSFRPGISKLIDMETGDAVESSISQGEVIQAEPGNYTFVAAHSKGLFGTGVDPLLNAETNFIYVDNFILENDTRYVISDAVRELEKVYVENSRKGEPLQLEGSSIGLRLPTENGKVRLSFSNNLNLRADTGTQKLYYGGDMQMLEKWGFGAYSRETNFDIAQGTYPSNEKLNSDLFNSSQAYVYYDIFQDNPDNVNLSFENKETLKFENSGVYGPSNITDIYTYIYYGGSFFNPLLSLENNKIMSQNDFLNLTYDAGSNLNGNPSFFGEWDGDFNQKLNPGADVGGLPAKPPDFSWEPSIDTETEKNLEQITGFGHNGSIYNSDSEEASIFWDTYLDDKEIEDSDFWTGAQVQTSGWDSSSADYNKRTAELSVDYPTDFALQTLTEIDAVIQEGGELPNIDKFINYEPTIEEGDWNLQFSHSGDNVTIYKRGSGSWEEVRDSTNNPIDVTLTNIFADKLDIRIKIREPNKTVNYTFHKFASAPEELSSNLDITENFISGNITRDGRKVKNLELENRIDDNLNQTEYSNSGLDFERQSCQLNDQRLTADPYLYFTFSEVINSGEFDPDIDYRNEIFDGNVNNISIDSNLNCNFNYKLATNETGILENRTSYSPEKTENETYFEWMNQSIDNEIIEFQIWTENDGKWYKSDKKNFEVSKFKLEADELRINQFTTIKTSHKSNITVNTSEFSYTTETEPRQFINSAERFGFETGVQGENITPNKWYQSNFSGSGNHSAAVDSDSNSVLSLNFSGVSSNLGLLYVGDLEYSINDGDFENLTDSEKWQRKIISHSKPIEKVKFRGRSGAVDSVKTGVKSENYSVIFRPRSADKYEINSTVTQNGKIRTSKSLQKTPVQDSSHL